MDNFSQALESLLRDEGADLVGYGDLSGIPGAEMPRGVSVAVAIPPEIIAGIAYGPTIEYFEAYHSLNARLNRIVTRGAEYLAGRGFQARAQTTTSVVESADHRTPLPHKTVATRAGLGWIGRCALLVTERYGSGIRISSLVTDAPLPCGTPIDSARCGSCRACQLNCPGGAVQGALWDVHTDRPALLDASRCHDTARARSATRIHKEITICGKCIEVCPYTRRYLARAKAD